MKKCPTCEKTFEDSLRFCQVDGTPLVDDAPAFDPYATIVSSPIPPATAVEPPEPPAIEVAVEAAASDPVPVAAPIAEPDDVLDLPSDDPLKTVYVSDAEMRDVFGGEASGAEESAVEERAVEQVAAPEPPSFTVPDVPAPSFREAAPPPSPFAVSDAPAEESAPEPSVFDEPALPPPPVFDEPAPSFDEAATMIQPLPSVPFEPPAPTFEPVSSAPAFETRGAAPVAEWTPPPAPDASWQNQEIGSNTPFQPPPAGTGGVNQTLAIISLVLGIVSLCCYISPITGAAALITGFMAMKKVNTDPANFGGKGLAIAGMITGGIFFLIGTAYYIIIILMYAGILAGSILQGY